MTTSTQSDIVSTTTKFAKALNHVNTALAINFSGAELDLTVLLITDAFRVADSESNSPKAVSGSVV